MLGMKECFWTLRWSTNCTSVRPKPWTMKVCGKTVKRALKLAKILGTLVCWIVFAFWGIQALQKFLSRPISSSISVINGDDGLSNLIYPAITICTDNVHNHFHKILYYGDVQRCDSASYTSYNKFLSGCLVGYVNEVTTTSSTTTTWGLFGGYDYEGETFVLFASVEEENQYATCSQLQTAKNNTQTMTIREVAG